MRRLPACLFALTLVACSGGDDPPKPSFCDEVLIPAVPSPGSPGSVLAMISGTFPMDFLGTASAYQQGSTTAAFTVIDGFRTDAANAPTGELFLFLRSGAKVTQAALVPVTLDQIRDPSFVPSGSFAVFATAFDSATKDYTRWLLGTSGCLRVGGFEPGAIGGLAAAVAMSGQWQSNTGQPLGTGVVSATVSAPTLDFRSGATHISEMMSATITGVRAKAFSASTLDAYQVLFPAQRRLLIVGTQPADTTRELWLSLTGVPQSGDSIELGTVTLAEARAGRAVLPTSFGMLRMLELDNGAAVVREIWRSTSGWVKFGTVIQNGPLALCGMVSGTFAMTTQGTSLAQPATDLGVSTVSAGSFTTRMTVLSQSDTLIEQATLPTAQRIGFLAPTSSSGIACP